MQVGHAGHKRKGDNALIHEPDHRSGGRTNAVLHPGLSKIFLRARAGSRCCPYRLPLDSTNTRGARSQLCNRWIPARCSVQGCMAAHLHRAGNTDRLPRSFCELLSVCCACCSPHSFGGIVRRSSPTRRPSTRTRADSAVRGSNQRHPDSATNAQRADAFDAASDISGGRFF